jgi:hypothetical protein
MEWDYDFLHLLGTRAVSNSHWKWCPGMLVLADDGYESTFRLEYIEDGYLVRREGYGSDRIVSMKHSVPDFSDETTRRLLISLFQGYSGAIPEIAEVGYVLDALDTFASKDGFKLCYICPRTNFAYFTTVDLQVQWGDDWNDAPYEHNAGEPYSHSGVDRSPHKLVKIAWEGPFCTPAQSAAGNSNFSVEAINKGAVPWLTPDECSASEHTEPILAGASIEEFISKVELAGGCVYIPRVLFRGAR